MDDTSNRNRMDEAPEDIDVMTEATGLLRRIQFSPHRGFHADGKRVVVDVAPRWNRNRKTMSVIISCHALAYRTVDWEGIPMFLIRTSAPDDKLIKKNIAAMGLLNRRGQVMIHELAPATYGLLASSVWGRSPQPLPRRLTTPWDRVYSSNDRRVRVTVGEDEPTRIEVAAETRDRGLESALVHYCFVCRESNRCYESGQVRLAPSTMVGGIQDADGGERRLEGRWTKKAGFALAATDAPEVDFAYCVVP